MIGPSHLMLFSKFYRRCALGEALVLPLRSSWKTSLNVEYQKLYTYTYSCICFSGILLSDEVVKLHLLQLWMFKTEKKQKQSKMAPYSLFLNLITLTASQEFSKCQQKEEEITWSSMERIGK